MAIKSITFENFKNRLSGHYTFGARNTIKGPNGSGKSTIKDLLAFGFCGTDSNGVRNPTHLISIGQESLKVTIETDRSLIMRTLTTKGNGTIKTEINGITATYNQTQFEQAIGSTPDVFLSALIPGYFFELSDAKRKQVISDIMPKVDRVALLNEISGTTLTSEEYLKFGVNRRPDLVAGTVGQDRRQLDQTISTKRGRIEQLRLMATPEAPNVEDVSELLKVSEETSMAWTKYENSLKPLNAAKAANHRALQENAYNAQRRVELNAEIESIVLSKPVPPSTVIPELSLLAEVSANVRDVSDIENCGTCGQAVSPRYKEQMSSNNEKILEQTKKENDEIKAKNEATRAAYSAAFNKRKAEDSAYQLAVMDNRKLEAKKKSLELELAGIKDLAMIDIGEAPKAPEQIFSVPEHQRLLAQQNEYNRQLAIYQSRIKDYETAEAQVIQLQEEIANISVARDRLLCIEHALKRLPEVENSLQIGRFNTEQMIFDGDSVRVAGIPMKMLSTGEQLRIYWIFCREITEMMPKPHRMIFVDNCELLTDHETAWSKFTDKIYDLSKYQEFYSSCENSEFSITTEG